MNWRNTLIMLAVVAAAGIFVWRIEPYLKRTDPNSEAADLIFKGFADDRDRIDRVEMVRPDSTVTLVKMGRDHWEITQPISYRADDWRARDLVKAFEFMKALSVLRDTPDKPLDPARYALGEKDTPLEVNLYAGGEKLYGARMGALTPDENCVYVASDGSSDIHLVKEYARESFTKPVGYYRSPKVAFFQVSEVRKLLIAEEGQKKVEMVKEGGVWEMSFPVPDRGRYDAVKSFLEDLKALTVTDFGDKDPKDLPAKGLEPAKLSISVFTGAELDEQTVSFGSELPQGKRNCMMRGTPFLLAVMSEDVGKLNTDANEYRDRSLAHADPERIRKVTIERGDGTIVLERKGLDWEIAEPAKYEADNDIVLDTLQAVRDAEIKEFLDPKTEFRSAMKVTMEYPVEEEIEEFELSRPSAGDEFILAKRKGTDGIFKVAAALHEDLAKPVLGFRSRSVMEFNQALATRIERKGPGGPKIALVRGSKAEPWAVEGSPEKKVDTAAVKDLLWRLSGLKVDKLVGEFDPQALAKYGLAEPELIVTVETVDRETKGSHVLSVGKAREGADYYGIVGGGSSMVCKLSGGLVDRLKRALVEAEDKEPAEGPGGAEKGADAEDGAGAENR